MSRLRTIADAVPDSARVIADIGYDHGHLLATLARQRPEVGLVGIELQERSRTVFGQLQPAQVRQRVTLLTGSGLKPLAGDAGHAVLDQGPVDTAIIAGMGEHLIASLVADAPVDVLARVEQLVLCPADFRHQLRPALATLGWRSVADWVAVERRRHYEVLLCTRQAPPSPDWADSDEGFFGTLVGDTLRSYCQALASRHRGALLAPSGADTPVLRKLRRAKELAQG